MMLKWIFSKIFKRNIKTCDQCGCSINVKSDAALCLHGTEKDVIFELWICEPCCKRIAEEDDCFDEVKIAEED